MNIILVPSKTETKEKPKIAWVFLIILFVVWAMITLYVGLHLSHYFFPKRDASMMVGIIFGISWGVFYQIGVVVIRKVFK